MEFERTRTLRFPACYWSPRRSPGSEARWSRYLAELEDPERADALATLRRLARDRTLTLLTATKDIEISQAAVLADVIRS